MLLISKLLMTGTRLQQILTEPTLSILNNCTIWHQELMRWQLISFCWHLLWLCVGNLSIWVPGVIVYITRKMFDISLVATLCTLSILIWSNVQKDSWITFLCSKCRCANINKLRNVSISMEQIGFWISPIMRMAYWQWDIF